MDKIRSGSATDEERNEFKSLHEAKSMEILNTAPKAIFSITEVDLPIPPKARTNHQYYATNATNQRWHPNLKKAVDSPFAGDVWQVTRNKMVTLFRFIKLSGNTIGSR